jgi:hypothetical protein
MTQKTNIEPTRLIRLKDTASLGYSDSIGICIRPLTLQEVENAGHDVRYAHDPPWWVHFHEMGPTLIFPDEMQEEICDE